MVSSQIQIAELNYQIRRKQTEMDHLKRVLDKKRQNGMLTNVSETSLQGQQERILSDIRELEKQIRAIENTEARRSNLL